MTTLTARVMDAVQLGQALDAVQTFLRRFVVLTDAQAVAVTLWVAHTHAIDAADCTPYLQVTSATKRAGKTRLLETVEPLVARPWFTGRTSAAALVRKIDGDAPTLLLDESDAAFGGEREYAEALRGVLNSGYRRSGCATICVGQGAKITVRDFRTFGPKAIAGIGTLPGTVADRAIPIALRRRKADERCERWRARDGQSEAAPLHAALAAALEPLSDRLKHARPSIPTALGDRQADVWEPLLAIAEAAGSEWAAMASRAAALVGTIEEDDVAIELLGDLRDILTTEDPTDDVLATTVLLERLVALDDRPWATWRKGKPLTGHGLRRLLKPFDVHPDRFTAAGGKVRGYRRDAFADAIARYLPIEVAKWSSPNETGPEPAISKWPDDPVVATSKNAKTPITTGERPLGHFEVGETRVARCCEGGVLTLACKLCHQSPTYWAREAVQ